MAVKVGYRQTPEHVRARTEKRLATLRARPKPATKEWLAEQYWGAGRNCVQIGAELGKDPSTIRAWMNHYGIPTRPRGGTTSPGSFQPGVPNGYAGRRHLPETRERLRQARLTDGRVPYLKGGTHWLTGKASADHPNWRGGITPQRQAFYATREWKDAVKAVWHRANARCERCGADYRTVRRQHGPKFHVHHIVSFAVRELRAAVDNLALLCQGCHRFAHSNANTAREFLGATPCP